MYSISLSAEVQELDPPTPDRRQGCFILASNRQNKRRSRSGKLDSDRQFFSNKSMNSLIESLKKVKDFRHHKGQRHPLWFILLIVILGLMAGHLGYRALGAFALSQQRSLTKYFPISDK